MHSPIWQCAQIMWALRAGCFLLSAASFHLHPGSIIIIHRANKGQESCVSVSNISGRNCPGAA